MIYNCTNIIQTVFDKIPQQCLLCHQTTHTGQPLCEHCQADLPINALHCSCCSLPLFNEAQLCGQCQQQLKAYQSSHIPWRYESFMRQLIRKFKFDQDFSSGRLLIDLYIETLLKQHVPIPEVIIPVPSHPSRIRKRGINISLWLAKQIGKKLTVEVNNQLIEKKRSGIVQHELDRQQRLKNLQGAFAIKKHADYRHVAVIDDIVTTGATADEVSRVLKANGVEQIQVWALARTPL